MCLSAIGYWCDSGHISFIVFYKFNGRGELKNGYFSIPELTFEGGLIVGDSASLFISQKIKGIHVAMKSGMLAAETIFQSLLKLKRTRLLEFIL